MGPFLVVTRVFHKKTSQGGACGTSTHQSLPNKLGITSVAPLFVVRYAQGIDQRRSVAMAETVRKKAAKKASGKKRGRPRKETVQPKRGPGRPRKDAGDRMNVMDAGDALNSIETSTPASRTLTQREKNAFERNFGEGTAFDLDYGKLLIIALCIYIAVKVS